MLSNEDGMAPHRCLPTIVGWLSRREAHGNEFSPMAENDGQASRLQIFSFSRTETKSLTKGGSAQSIEDGVEITHRGAHGIFAGAINLLK